MYKLLLLTSMLMPLSDDDCNQLIAQLGSKSFHARSVAVAEFKVKMDLYPAVCAIHKLKEEVVTTKDPEVRLLCEQILTWYSSPVLLDGSRLPSINMLSRDCGIKDKIIEEYHLKFITQAQEITGYGTSDYEHQWSLASGLMFDYLLTEEGWTRGEARKLLNFMAKEQASGKATYRPYYHDYERDQ